MRFENAIVYLENEIISNGFVEVQNGTISAVGLMDGEVHAETAVDLSGFIVAPGFIDQHVHGAGGADVMDANSAALDTIACYLAREGITSFLATSATMPAAKIHQALRAVSDFKRHQTPGNGAEVLGVHLEGPFINHRYKGAQNEEFITEPDIRLFDALQESADNCIKMVTYAVEHDPKLVFLRHLVANGVTPSCGHSGATYEEVAKCIPEGLRCLTHFHNAMSGHHHHSPGVVTAGYCLDRLKVELIADDFHIHPAVLKMAYQTKGNDSIIIITDAVRAKGLPDGRYDLGGQSFIKMGRTCRLDSGVLAGSVLAMDVAIRNMVQYTGCSLHDAVKMASLNPARLLGVDQRKGSIAVGKDADLVVLDSEGNIRMTVVRGNVAYRS